MRIWWRRLVGAWRLLAGTLRRRDDDSDILEEMRFHLEMFTNKRVALGADPEAARDQLRSNALESIVRDIRYALRGLAHEAGFSTAAIVTVALGLAAAGTAFTMIDSLFLRPLPVRDGGRFVRVYFRLGPERRV